MVYTQLASADVDLGGGGWHFNIWGKKIKTKIKQLSEKDKMGIYVSPQHRGRKHHVEGHKEPASAGWVLNKSNVAIHLSALLYFFKKLFSISLGEFIGMIPVAD